MICPKCYYNAGASASCPQCGIYFKGYIHHKEHEGEHNSAMLLRAAEAEVDEDAPERIGFHDIRINTLALPATILIVLLAKLLKLPDMLFWYFFTIPTHEMGHATAAWLGSRFAIPIGAIIPATGFTSVGGKSSFITLLMLGAWSYLGYLGLKTRHYFAVTLAAFFLVNLVYWSFIADPNSADMFFVYGGAGGEFILSTMFITAFYYRMPDRLRWDFFRFPLLLVGTYALTSALIKWKDVALHRAPLPVGTFLSGSDDSAGDMNRLINTYHWTPDDLAASYYRLGKLCVVIVVFHYLFFLRVASRERMVYFDSRDAGR